MDELLSRLSIRSRLWLLFGTAVVVLLLVTGVALLNMAHAQRATHDALELGDQLTDAVNTARGTHVDYRRQVKEWKDLLLRGSKKERYDVYWNRTTTTEKNVAQGLE